MRCSVAMNEASVEVKLSAINIMYKICQSYVAEILAAFTRAMRYMHRTMLEIISNIDLQLPCFHRE